MIEYVSILGAADRQAIGYIDVAQSIIWHSVFFGVGDFEIFVKATDAMREILQIGNFVSRPDDIEVGIIEKLEFARSYSEGLMLAATGRFAKSILDRRHIMRFSGHQNQATVLSGNVESAARLLVQNNAIACTWDPRRNIDLLALGSHSGSEAIILDENGNPGTRQVTFDNLLTYSDALLEEYGLGASLLLDDVTGKLNYTVFPGVDRSMDNTGGADPVIFSPDFENLSESNYTDDVTAYKNAAYIGGKGEGLDRFYAELAGSESGLARRETFVNASSVSKTYKDDEDQEQEYSDAQYAEMLRQNGAADLAKAVREESFSGQISPTDELYKYGVDYSLGDIVTVQDNAIDKYANVRIREVTEVQDDNGYKINIKYE